MHHRTAPHSPPLFIHKAEIEILTKEVSGLQRELAQSLKSQEGYKKRVRESRESNSNLKYELRSATKKAKELTAEAEARDKLVETFTKILLQKVGLEGSAGGGDGAIGAEGNLEEEKIADAVVMVQMEEALSGLKIP